LDCKSAKNKLNNNGFNENQPKISTEQKTIQKTNKANKLELI
jgi:hypothetical protein